MSTDSSSYTDSAWLPVMIGCIPFFLWIYKKLNGRFIKPEELPQVVRKRVSVLTGQSFDNDAVNFSDAGNVQNPIRSHGDLELSAERTRRTGLNTSGGNDDSTYDDHKDSETRNMSFGGATTRQPNFFNSDDGYKDNQKDLGARYSSSFDKPSVPSQQER